MQAGFHEKITYVTHIHLLHTCGDDRLLPLFPEIQGSES